MLGVLFQSESVGTVELHPLVMLGVLFQSESVGTVEPHPLVMVDVVFQSESVGTVKPRSQHATGALGPGHAGAAPRHVAAPLAARLRRGHQEQATAGGGGTRKRPPRLHPSAGSHRWVSV